MFCQEGGTPVLPRTASPEVNLSSDVVYHITRNPAPIHTIPMFLRTERKKTPREFHSQTYAEGNNTSRDEDKKQIRLRLYILSTINSREKRTRPSDYPPIHAENSPHSSSLGDVDGMNGFLIHEIWIILELLLDLFTHTPLTNHILHNTKPKLRVKLTISNPPTKFPSR